MDFIPSRSGRVSLFFCDGDYDFCLRIEELVTLQEITQCGPAYLLTKLQTSEWLVQYLEQIIRLGLIGGGMSHQDAFKLTKQGVRSGNLLECVPIATTVVLAALCGVEDEVLGEQTGEEVTSPPPSAE